MNRVSMKYKYYSTGIGIKNIVFMCCNLQILLDKFIVVF